MERERERGGEREREGEREQESRELDERHPYAYKLSGPLGCHHVERFKCD